MHNTIWSADYLKKIAKEGGITLIDSNNPKKVALDFVKKFSK